jgi:hypothetical protein
LIVSIAKVTQGFNAPLYQISWPERGPVAECHHLSDATIIDAAPDLLEALDLAATYLDAEGKRAARHLKIIRAAIAKARKGLLISFP